MLPDQARVTFQDPLTARQLDERFDRIPTYPVYLHAQFFVSSSTTSSTAAIPADAQSKTWYKEEPWTDLVFHISWSQYLSAGSDTSVSVGIRIAGAPIGATTYDLGFAWLFHNGGAEHRAVVGMDTWDRYARAVGTWPLALPAGKYTATPMWHRPGGAGTITSDTQDQVRFTIQECVPPRT